MNQRIDTQPRRGTAIVEFALIFMLTMVIAIGAADFGRIFFHGITIANAVSSGAHFGSHSGETAGRYTGISAMVTGDSNGIGAVTVTPDQYCACPGELPIDSCSELLETTCAGYGRPRAYVRVKAENTMQSSSNFYFFSDGTEVSQRAWMRVR